MATGGQDGKVVVWDLAASAEPTPAAEAEDTDVSRSTTDVSRSTADVSRSSTDGRKSEEHYEDNHYPDTTVAVEEGVYRSGSGAGTGTGGVGASGVGGSARDAFSAEPISIGSGLSDDTVSAERESSDLGSGGIRGKGGNFPGLEVRGGWSAACFGGTRRIGLCSRPSAGCCSCFLEARFFICVLLSAVCTWPV